MSDSMKEKLTDFRDLMTLLGYRDTRSVSRWCEKNRVPVYKMGKKSYVSSQYLTDIIDNQLVTFEKAEKVREKKRSITHNLYQPKNEIISKYLEKYESINKTKAA
jgi:hypothetical protein